MSNSIWEGIKSIFVGGVRVVAGVVNAAWSVLKYAVKAAVWVVAGVFTIAKHLTSYVIKTFTELFTPTRVVVVPPSKGLALVSFLEEQEKKNGLREDPEDMEIKKNIINAADKGQSMAYAIGKDADGDVAVSDPQFIAAGSWDEKIAEANRNNQIYTKGIRIAK